MYTAIERNIDILDDFDPQNSSIIAESSHNGLNKFKNFVKDLARKKPRGGEEKESLEDEHSHSLLEDEHSSSSSSPQEEDAYVSSFQFLVTSPASSTSSILDLETFDKYSRKEEAPSLLTNSVSSSTYAGTLSKEEITFVQTILEEEGEDESSSSSFAPLFEEEEDLPCSLSYVGEFSNLDTNRNKEDRVNVSLSAPKGACWEVISTPKKTTALLQAITDDDDDDAKKSHTTTTEDSTSKEDDSFDNFLIRPLPPHYDNTSSSSPSLIAPASVSNKLTSQHTRDSAWTLSPDTFDTKIESLKKKTKIPKNALSLRSNITTTTASSSTYRMRKSNSARNIVQSTRGSKMNRASSVGDLISSSRTAVAHKTLKKTNSSRHLQGNCSTKRRQQRPKSPSSEKIPTNNNSAKSRHSKTAAGGASTSNNTNSTNRRDVPKSKSNINCSIDKKSKDVSLKAGRSLMMKDSKVASDRDILQRRRNRTNDSNDETTKRNNNDNERRERRENSTSVAEETRSSVERRSLVEKRLSLMKRGKAASDRHLFRSHENGGGRLETRREQQSHRTSSTDKRSSMMKRKKALSDRPLIGAERPKQRRELQQHQNSTRTRSTERVKTGDRERLQQEKQQQQQHHHSSERKGRRMILAAGGRSPSVRDLRKEILRKETAHTAAVTTTTTGTSEIEKRKQQEPQRRTLMRSNSFFISQQGKREKDFERKTPQRETSFSASKSCRRSLSLSERSTRRMLASSQKRGKERTLSVSEHHRNSNMDSGEFEFCNPSKHNTSSNTEQPNAATKMTTTTITNGNDKLSPQFDASPSDMPPLIDNSPVSLQSFYARTAIKRMNEEKNKKIIKPSLNNATTAAAANKSITQGSVDRLLNTVLIVPDQDDCSVISDLRIPVSLLTSPSSVASKSILALGKTIKE